MRFGICSAPEQAAELAAAGWEYVEWPLRAVAELGDREYARLRELARSLPVAPEAFNVMLPGSIKVTGPDADLGALREYLGTAYRRAAELGGRVVVFGSGGSRTLPDGWQREAGMAQLAEACRVAGEAAEGYGVTVALEPLNPRETNLVNTVAEGMAVVERAAHPSVGVLSDLYHVAVGGEGFEGTVGAGPLLAHVHVALPEDRSMPLPGRGGDVLRRYLEALKAAGYDGRVSVEGRWAMGEAAAGLRYLRETWEGIAGGA